MNSVAHWSHKIVQFLLPATCLCCDRFIESGDLVCSNCEVSLYPVIAPYCPKCSLPRENHEGVNALCKRCILEKRYFDQVFAAYEYEANIKQIFSRAKYGRREDTIQSLAKLAIKRNRLELPAALKKAVWTSVPMHPKDLSSRGFNCSRLILDVFNQSNIGNEDHNLLEKTLPRVVGNSKSDRETFSQKAFRLRKPLADPMESVVVVDDVMSTGATLASIAKCLKKAGVKKVFGVVLARNV